MDGQRVPGPSDAPLGASPSCTRSLKSPCMLLPCDLEPGLAYRDALALQPPTRCLYATFDAQVRPVSMCCRLDVHADLLRLRAAPRRSTRRSCRTSCRFVSHLS